MCKKYNKGNEVNGICKCCDLVDKNKTIKKVVFCKFCNANLCEQCFYDTLKRTKAFAINFINPK